MDIKLYSVYSIADGWSGPWFPNAPGKEDNHLQGREHYNPPDTKQSINLNSSSKENISVNKTMGLVDPKCDNGKVIKIIQMRYQ